MTIATEETVKRNDYLGDGTQTVYSFTKFKVLYEVGEVKPYSIKVAIEDLTGAITYPNQGTDYTVSLNSDGFGTVTFAVAPASNYKIALLPDYPSTQQTDYIKSGTDKFPAESHEKALDKLTLITQQLKEVVGRAVTVPATSTLTGIEFPISSSYSNQVVTINNDGTNLSTKNIADIGLAPVTNFAKTLLDDNNASEARTTLGTAIGTDVQAYNSNLAALSGLTGAANKIPYFTGAGAMALTNLVLLPSSITISNNTTDVNNDIDFSAGNFQFSDGSGQAILSALTKRLDASWAAGTNQGGLFSGSKANSTWYHCFVIYNPTTGISDCGFDTSVTAANIPSGYTKYKRVGSIRTDSSGNILKFIQEGKYFLLDSVIQELVITVGTVSATTLTITTPLNVKVFALLKGGVATGTTNQTVVLRIHPVGISGGDRRSVSTTSSSSQSVGCGSSDTLTNTLSQVQYSTSVNTSTGDVYIWNHGWLDYQL